MYELLTGTPVIQAPTALACMYAHINEPPLPFNQVRPALEAPAGLERVVMKMLAKEPENRFQSISQLMPVLSDILLDEVTRNPSREARSESVRSQLPREVVTETVAEAVTTSVHRRLEALMEQPEELRILEDFQRSVHP